MTYLILGDQPKLALDLKPHLRQRLNPAFEVGIC